AAMAQALGQVLDDPRQFYVIERDQDGELVWIETAEDGTVTTLHDEPETGAFKRGLVRFMSWLPIEWLL
ncbi:MAG: phospholipase D family protein, partial [Rhodobacteraceae bacterium]|nr:phospholipase D family protein [Paracoccaceae bacterium]